MHVYAAYVYVAITHTHDMKLIYVCFPNVCFCIVVLSLSLYTFEPWIAGAEQAMPHPKKAKAFIFIVVLRRFQLQRVLKGNPRGTWGALETALVDLQTSNPLELQYTMQVLQTMRGRVPCTFDAWFPGNKQNQFNCAQLHLHIYLHMWSHMAGMDMSQDPGTVLNPKIAGKWMFFPP